MGASGKTVVLAAEGSYTRPLIEWYLSNFHQQEDRVVVVHAEDSDQQDKWLMLASGRAAMSSGESRSKCNSVFRPKRCCKLEKHCLSMLKQQQVNGTFCCREGRLGEVIVAIAKEESASLVVMADRHQSRLWRALVGSCQDYVVRHTGLPVMTYSLVQTKKSLPSQA